MKRIIATALSALLFMSMAFAAGPANKTSTPPEQEQAAASTKTDDLTIRDCELILRGLRGLDGFPIVVNQGKPGETIVPRNYEFGNAKLRDAIYRNIVGLEQVQKRANENRKATFNEYAQGQAEVPVPKRVEYSEKLASIDDLPCDFAPKRISIKSLLLDKNEIQGTVLFALDKILDE